MVDWLEANPNAELLTVNRLLPMPSKSQPPHAEGPPNAVPPETPLPKPPAIDPDIPPLILDEPGE